MNSIIDGELWIQLGGNPDPTCDFCGVPLPDEAIPVVYKSSRPLFQFQIDQLPFTTKFHDPTDWWACADCARIIGSPHAASRLALRFSEINPEFGSDGFRQMLRSYRVVLPSLTREDACVH